MISDDNNLIKDKKEKKDVKEKKEDKRSSSSGSSGSSGHHLRNYEAGHTYGGLKR